MRVNWAASAAAIAIVAATSSNAHAQEQAPAAGATVDELLVTGGSQVTLPPGGQVARGARVGLFGALDYMDTPFAITSYTEKLIRNQQARSAPALGRSTRSARCPGM
jgi:iron complex outermembrane receptor protein